VALPFEVYVRVLLRASVCVEVHLDENHGMLMGWFLTASVSWNE